MICGFCDGHVSRGEPTASVDGEPVHIYCDVSTVCVACDNPDCQWWRVSHAGHCVT